MSSPRPTALSLADLVVLSLLIERPMHGYEVAQELERRQVDEWASVSRPQIYYSLKKLAASRLILDVREAADASGGPERQVYRPSAEGRRALSRALDDERWVTSWPPQPFHTWLALAWQSSNPAAQLQRRRAYLESRLREEREALREIIRETSAGSDAASLVTLVSALIETELAWLDDMQRRHRPGV